MGKDEPREDHKHWIGALEEERPGLEKKTGKRRKNWKPWIDDQARDWKSNLPWRKELEKWTNGGQDRGNVNPVKFDENISSSGTEGPKAS